MAWDSELEELMPHSVQISTGTTRTKHGVLSFSAASTYQARVVSVSAEDLSQNGSVSEVRTYVYVHSTATFPADCKVTLPNGTSPPLLRIEQFPDDDGLYYQRFAMGWQQ